MCIKIPFSRSRVSIFVQKIGAQTKKHGTEKIQKKLTIASLGRYFQSYINSGEEVVHSLRDRKTAVWTLNCLYFKCQIYWCLIYLKSVC